MARAVHPNARPLHPRDPGLVVGTPLLHINVTIPNPPPDGVDRMRHGLLEPQLPLQDARPSGAVHPPRGLYGLRRPRVRKCDAVRAHTQFDVHDLAAAAQIDAELETPPPEFV